MIHPSDRRTDWRTAIAYSTLSICYMLSRAKTAIYTNMLPPTSTAASFHSLRVFDQVQFGKGILSMLKNAVGKFVMIGWYQSIQTRMRSPQSLLKLGRCTCMSGCGTLRCGCTCQGLAYSATCSECRDVCENVMPPDYNTNKKDDEHELWLF